VVRSNKIIARSRNQFREKDAIFEVYSRLLARLCDHAR